MKRKRKAKQMASQIAKVPVGCKLVHEDADTRVYIDASNGTLYLVRLEYVTYRLRGPRA